MSAIDDAELRAAIEALLDPGRFREIEQRIAAVAPQLQKVLVSALADGGWFDEPHASEIDKVSSIGELDERTTALRTLLAEEARVAMMVGVAVGWELAHELPDGGAKGRPENG